VCLLGEARVRVDGGWMTATAHYRPVFRSATGRVYALVMPMRRASDRGLLDAVCRQVADWARTGLRPRIAFTVPSNELVAMEATEKGRDVLARLHRHGFHVVVEDHGDVAPLARLRDLSFDELYIDRGFGTAGAVERERLTDVRSPNELDDVVRRHCALGRGLRSVDPMTAEQATVLLRRTPCEESVAERVPALVG
jgi:hypothetical protein